MTSKNLVSYILKKNGTEKTEDTALELAVLKIVHQLGFEAVHPSKAFKEKGIWVEEYDPSFSYLPKLAKQSYLLKPDWHILGTRVLLYVDGQACHSTAKQLAKDNWEDRKLSELGWRVLRIPEALIYCPAPRRGLFAQDLTWNPHRFTGYVAYAIAEFLSSQEKVWRLTA